ncbi:MAG: hypothetical protein ACJ8KU_05595 [Chthoniobacterales bacterium]
MKRRNSSEAGLFNLRILGVSALVACSAMFALVAFGQLGGDAGTGHVGPAPGGPSQTWSQVIVNNPGGVNNLATDDSSCVDGVNCERFHVIVDGTTADWAGQKMRVQLNWQDAIDEYDIYIHKSADCSGPILTQANNGPGITSQIADVDIASNGTGDYCVHVALNTVPDPTDKYTGKALAVPLIATPPPAAPQDPGPRIGYENFEAPGVLTTASQASSGGVTVEYLGRGAGEPSVGANWVTGIVNFQSDLQTLFIKFNDDCALARSLWENRRAPTSQFIDSDPIGFTDHTSTTSNRVFAGELTLLSPDAVKISHTDDDGVTWVPDQTGGIASAVDHETIGGGPYAAPLTGGTVYPNAVYYCSQDIATALCSRSDDGGSTYGPSVPIYTLTDCAGLHGHVKVAPDGTVYVPNRSCNSPKGIQTAVAVSTDNGMTWSIRPVVNAGFPLSGASDDPAVSIDAKGRLYCLFAYSGTSAAVGVSTDQGKTWPIIYDVGAGLGLTNIAFPAATAGDDGRAAVAFYASKGGVGDSSADTYTGTWHLYVAHTFDGGQHWTTTDATPSLPMQRMGLLRGGGGPVDRNLLDFFDITTDVNGRVIVGYVDGCSGGDCTQAPVNADGSTSVIGNTYSATAAIMRQSSGRRMFAAKDPAATSVPGGPFVTQRRVNGVVHLAWNEGDPGNNGGTPPDQTVANFQIFRSTTQGGEGSTPLATVAGTASRYDDTTASDPGLTYYYKVVATNSVGSSCPSEEVAAGPNGDTCTGIVIHQNLPTNPEATGGSETNPPVGPTASPAPSPAATPPIPGQYLIDYIAVAEPPDKAGQLVFKMKVKGDMTAPLPNSRWRIVWDWVGNIAHPNKDEQEYVGATTDASGAITYEYGTVATLSAVVIGVPSEKMAGAANSGTADANGLITIVIDKSKVGNPQTGDILSAINGRTYNSSGTAERSTLLVDHTFIKGNTDNSYPPATYTLTGNVGCGAAAPAPTPATPAQLLNISTRLDVQHGDNAMIAGFILIANGASDNVLARALGPSLSVNGQPVNGRLGDPTLELHDGKGAVLAFNDNWKNASNASDIEATGLAPTDDRESAILQTLGAGAYTAVMHGAGDTTGIGLVEAYDLNKAAAIQLANISTRGFVETGDNVMIGGFIAGPADRGNTTIVVRAIGPTLASARVPSPLQDPNVELHDANGAVIASNDNWETDMNAAQVAGVGLAPKDPRESALYRLIAPGSFTAIVRGNNNTTGNALVEVYNLE